LIRPRGFTERLDLLDDANAKVDVFEHIDHSRAFGDSIVRCQRRFVTFLFYVLCGNLDGESYISLILRAMVLSRLKNPGHLLFDTAGKTLGDKDTGIQVQNRPKGSVSLASLIMSPFSLSKNVCEARLMKSLISHLTCGLDPMAGGGWPMVTICVRCAKGKVTMEFDVRWRVIHVSFDILFL
jgi:hypothetical protein